jgi:methyl-accepting chemotaxis protein
MREEYDTIFRQCVSLNTELHKLVPLAKQMHLLSSNAVSSAARAGSEGDAFRVLTQDIQLLGDDVSHCIDDTQKIIVEIVMLASSLARLFSSYATYGRVLGQTANYKESHTKDEFFSYGQQEIAKEIRDNNIKLARSLNLLGNILSPVSMLAKKGEYLAVCSSVEAASSGEHGASFEAVSSMLRELVKQLGQHSQRQRSLLRDLSEAMELQQNNMRNLLYAR